MPESGTEVVVLQELGDWHEHGTVKPVVELDVAEIRKSDLVGNIGPSIRL